MLTQGSIIWLDFSPTAGHEQKGHRPALVVSAKSFNTSMGGIVWVVPVTSKTKERPEEVALPDGLPVSGVLLLSQIRALDVKARGFKIAGQVSEDFMTDEVLGRLIAVFTG